MLEFLKHLIGLKEGDAGMSQKPDEPHAILRTIIHSDALTRIIQETHSPIDDLILQLVRALVPREAV